MLDPEGSLLAQRIPELIWTNKNREHVARQGVTVEEVEEARANNPRFRNGKYGRYFVIGQTNGGRWLIIVIERSGYVVTARDATERERKL